MLCYKKQYKSRFINKKEGCYFRIFNKYIVSQSNSYCQNTLNVKLTNKIWTSINIPRYQVAVMRRACELGFRKGNSV